MKQLLGGTLAATLASAALLAGCGDDSDGAPTSQTRQQESAHSVPELPRGWEVHANRAGGFAFGLPPGWRARDRGTTTGVRSFDGLVVLTVAADRTSEALAIDPAQAATRTLASLEAFAGAAEAGRAQPFEHRYQAYQASGPGRSARDVEQELTVVVLRRGEAASITVLIAANADQRAKPARRIADRVVRTLRTQPPSAAVR